MCASLSGFREIVVPPSRNEEEGEETRGARIIAAFFKKNAKVKDKYKFDCCRLLGLVMNDFDFDAGHHSILLDVAHYSVRILTVRDFGEDFTASSLYLYDRQTALHSRAHTTCVAGTTTVVFLSIAESGTGSPEMINEPLKRRL